MKKLEQIKKNKKLYNVLNILSALFTGIFALFFAVYALTFKSLPIIEKYYNLLIWLTAAIIAILLIAYIIFYIFDKQSFFRTILCGLICLDIFALLFYAVCVTGIIKQINTVEGLRNYISQFGSLMPVLFILFSFLQVVILPVPGSVSVAAGVLLFGPFWCTIYSFIGIVSGSLVAFFIGRVAGYKVACWIVGKDDLDKWLQKIKGKDYLILTLMFLLPMFPDDVLCFVAGISSMGSIYFIIMIIISRAISVSTTAYSLDLIPFNTWWGILTWIAIAAVVIVAFLLVYKYSDKIDAFIKRKFTRKDKKNKKNK
jgi:uncharacterized membrane protein YdjX (TVP38/TMEM64 family)